MTRLPSWIGYAMLGPVSGPLTAGAVRNWRNGQRVLASLYVIALVEAVVLTPFLLGDILSLPHVS